MSSLSIKSNGFGGPGSSLGTPPLDSTQGTNKVKVWTQGDLADLASRRGADAEALSDVQLQAAGTAMVHALNSDVGRNHKADTQASLRELGKSMLAFREHARTREHALFHDNIAEQQKAINNEKEAAKTRSSGRIKQIIAEGVAGGLEVIGGTAGGVRGYKSASATAKQQGLLKTSRHNDAVAKPHELGKQDVQDLQTLSVERNNKLSQLQTETPDTPESVKASNKAINKDIDDIDQKMDAVRDRPAQRAQQSADAHDQAADYEVQSSKNRTQETVITTLTRACDSITTSTGKSQELNDGVEADELDHAGKQDRLDASVLQNFSQEAGESGAKADAVFDKVNLALGAVNNDRPTAIHNMA